MRQVFPRRLTHLRTLRQISQTHLAQLCAVAPSTIAAIERGEMKDIKASTIVALCAELAVTPDYLLGYDSDSYHAHQMTWGRWDPRHAYEGKVDHCMVCGAADLAATNGEQHGLIDCIVRMRLSGRTIEHIVALFGLHANAVEYLIEMGYEAMRTRHRKGDPSGGAAA